ncbi:MAG: hypothetical protein AB7F74_22280 [Parvibaculaceae bacterium]
MCPVTAKRVARSLAVCVPLCLAAGAHAHQVPEPLVEVWVTLEPLRTVEACVIKALDADERTYSRISPSVKHVAKVRVPDSVVEIRPVKGHVVADVAHYVRLEKIADAITRVAFYSSDQSKQTMAKALSSCGPG